VNALAFTKMQGLGNDFVVLDGVNARVALAPEQVRTLADRHFGIGCDQVLIAERASVPGADLRCRIYNADGGEVEHCGNGVRALVRFARARGLVSGDRCVLETGAGLIEAVLLPDGAVRVAMGVPRFAPAAVPFEAPAEALDYPLEVDGEVLHVAVVGLGNPHAVLRVTDAGGAPVARLGPRVEHHPRFPRRVNVGFLEVTDAATLRLRVWERGAGETLACGSGACAAAVAACRWGLAGPQVRVHLPGGALTVEWEGPAREVYLTGPATTVFEGSITL
jgi:diaminopimelate epimerase